MNIQSVNKLTIKDLELFDFTITLIYRGFNLWQFRQGIKKHDVIWGIIRANQVVNDFLRGV